MKKWNSYSITVAGAFIMLAFLAGCASTETMVAYEGPPLPKEQVAIIGSPSFLEPIYGPLPSISCIDGKTATKRRVLVLPGKHQVAAGFSYDKVSGGLLFYGLLTKSYSSTLEFEVQAGHEYVVNADVIDSQPLMWVKDITTNQKITQHATVDNGHGLYFGKCPEKP